MRKYLHFFTFYILLMAVGGITNLTAQSNTVLSENEKLERFNLLLDSSEVYYNRGDYGKDLALSFDLLKLALDLDDPFYIHKGYRNIAYNYMALGDTLLAKESFQKSEKHAMLSKNDTAIAQTYMDLANIYSFDLEKKKEVFEYHNKSIELFGRIGDSVGLAKAHYNFVLAAMEYEDMNTAYVNIIKAKKLIKHGDPGYEIALYNLLAEYHLFKENYEMADKYFEKVIKDAENGDFTLELEDAYFYYSQSLYEQGKFEEAYNAQTKSLEYQELNDVKKIDFDGVSNSATFQISEYRKDVKAAELQYQLQAEIVESKSRLNTILIIVSTCIIIFFIGLFLAYRNRKMLVKELKQKNKEYLAAKEHSERLAKAKSKFFSTVSHELRTPLYGVIGLSTILLEDKSLHKHKKDLKSLKFSADYLLALINDVLHINKIESNNLEEQNVEFNVRSLIKKITDSFEYMRIQKNNEIHIHVSESVPQLIFGDSVRLSQILMNLISNACKFTENGNIYVIAETDKSTPKATTIKFYVRDTGVGIPKEKQDGIFDEFSQLDTHTAYQGSGLGLSIVKKLLKLSDAKLHLQSKVGRGSIFTFSLTFDNVVVAKEKESTKQLDLKLLHGKNVLIVEDNRINQMVTKKILAKHQVTSSVAENGVQAVDMIKKAAFDLILMDINMPVMNGIDATREIRTFNKQIPIIALTAVEVEEIRHTIYEVGMNDIIVKPYDVTIFVQTILKNMISKSIENESAQSSLKVI